VAKLKFTGARVREFTCPAGGATQAFLWDVDAPGLGLRATAGGKSYVFQARLDGRALRTTIGNALAWGIDEARAEARRLQRMIDIGQDPREAKREQAEAVQAKRAKTERQDVTAGEAWRAYIEARRHKWSARHLQAHEYASAPGGELRTRGRRPGEPERTRPGVLVPLLGLKLRELDDATLRAWLEPLAQRTPAQAMQAWRLLRACLAWCVDNPAYVDAVRPCNPRIARDVLAAPKPKDDCLQREQLAPWFEAVRRIHNPVISAYLQILLLTGARREELAGLRWENVCFQWLTMTIKDKVSGERTIPLTPYVGALLAALPRRNDAAQWVFTSSTSASGRLVEPRFQHAKALDAAGLPHLSLHGLRRSFGTLAEWVEVPVGIVAQIMGHAPSALAEKHYRRRPIEMLRLWHSKIERWILSEADIEQPDERPAPLRLVAGGRP